MIRPVSYFPVLAAACCVTVMSCIVWADTVVVSILAEQPPAADPTDQIDRFVQQRWDQLSVRPAMRCSDRSFVRRVYLDLAGRVPTPAEVDAFVQSTEPNRRSVLIDQLLKSEDYVQHFSDIFDALLMGRAAENKYSQRVNHRWREYLERLIRNNRPWNEVAKEILLARPDDEQHRGAVWYLYERNNKHQQIAESIAPAFFGVRIECAQCHDHMMADEIKQEHYWGLVAFFNRSKNADTKNGPQVAESAIGGFSEFANIEGDSSPNLLTFIGAETIHEDRPEPDAKQEEADHLYRPGEREGDPKIPLFSRREKFVQQIVDDHPLVAKAMVNRLWAMLMSRGIVHPYDEMDSVHPPSHPELLDWLATDFVRSNYDIKRLIRAIANCQAYQLDSKRPDGVEDPATFAWYLERPLIAEQFARSIQLVAHGQIADDKQLLGAFRQQFREVLPDANLVTVSDSLFLSNNTQLDSFLNASTQPDHLVPRLIEIEDPTKRVDLLVRTVFGRPASEEETVAIVKYLEVRRENLDLALKQVLWSLLCSAEFRFNH